MQALQQNIPYEKCLSKSYLCGTCRLLKEKYRSAGSCGFSGTEMEAAAVRRRHYNNMECIVVLHCSHVRRTSKMNDNSLLMYIRNIQHRTTRY